MRRGRFNFWACGQFFDRSRPSLISRSAPFWVTRQGSANQKQCVPCTEQCPQVRDRPLQRSLGTMEMPNNLNQTCRTTIDVAMESRDGVHGSGIEVDGEALPPDTLLSMPDLSHFLFHLLHIYLRHCSFSMVETDIDATTHMLPRG